MMKGVVAIVAVWCIVVLVAAQVHETAAAASCKPSELQPCGPAMIGGKNPTAECCSNLKEYLPCICKYIDDPQVRPYFGNPNAKKTAAVCGVTLPICIID